MTAIGSIQPRLGLGIVVLIAALAMTLVELPQRAQAAIPAAAGACVAGWREIPIPDKAFISTPFDVVTRKGKPAWILGGTNSGILALRWNGSAWKRSAGATSGHRGLVGGAPLGDKKVLGVGYYRRNAGDGEGSMRPISGRVLGTRWKSRFVSRPPGPRATLASVVNLPGGKAWAVGTRLQNGKLKAYAARWTGSSWRRKEPGAGTGSGLQAIERAPSGAIWAVGWKEANPGRPRPYIAKLSGGKWRRSKSAPLEAGSAVLTDVEFRTGRDGWAVGYITKLGTDRHTAILQHWNGNAWKSVGLPWANDASALPRSVAVGSGGEMWIAGTLLATNTRETRGFIAHRKNGTWEVDTLAVPNDIRSEVMDVEATKWGAVAAANVGASLLVLQSCGESQAALASGNPAGHKIEVGNMQARREAIDDPYHDARGAADPAPRGSFSVGSGEDSDGFGLAAPVKSKGFFVKDMARSSGLAQWTKTYDGFAAHFDNNGYRDVFIGRHGSVKPRLAMLGPGGFSNGPTGAFSSVDRHGCDSSDVDRDGSRDILCAVGAARGKAIQRHELTLAPNREKRDLVRGTLGIADPLGRGRQVAFIKLNGDSYPEVFISNAPDRDDGLPGYNRFYRNKKGKFVPAPAAGLDRSHGAECVHVGDVDKDGDQDLVYCTQYGFGNRSAGLRFMRNERGKLKDRTKRLDIKQIGDVDVAFGDVTGDGRKDLVQLSTSRVRVSKWTRNGYRKIYESKISSAWAVETGDASGDGKDDIYIVRGNDRANKADRLLVSRKGGKKYRSVRIPQTTKGSADDVFSIDYDKNGHTDFVVLNGRKKAGPIQLLASFPRR